jgi:UDP-glucose 4-epimerase
MKLLVTGGAGYVGSVCAEVLLEQGHEVVVVDDLSTGNADAVPAGARFVEADMVEAAPELLGGGSHPPFDGVLHFAAKSLVGESMAEPERYWHGNVVKTLQLLEAMRAAGTPRLVFSSTAATYGEPESVPITEDAPARPTNTYGATKLAIDHAITSYAAAHGLAATSLRYFNVAGAYAGFGERHATETHLIPLVLQVAAGRRPEILVFGTDWPTPDGTAVRDYIHVRDLADAHLLALQNSRPGEHRIYNLGNGTGFSVREVIASCERVTGGPIAARDVDRRAGDPAVLIASSQKAITELGWRPRHTAIDEIVADAWEFLGN